MQCKLYHEHSAGKERFTAEQGKLSLNSWNTSMLLLKAPLLLQPIKALSLSEATMDLSISSNFFHLQQRWMCFYSSYVFVFFTIGIYVTSYV